MFFLDNFYSFVLFSMENPRKSDKPLAMEDAVKKFVLVVALAIVPLLAFAETDIGLSGLYFGNPTSISKNTLNKDSVGPGLDLRAKLWIFQADLDATMIGKDSFLVMPTAGLSLDVLFLRVGAGMGPVAYLEPGADEAFGIFAWTLKASADLLLGPFYVGVFGYYLSWDKEPSYLVDNLSVESLKDPANWKVGAVVGFRLR